METGIANGISGAVANGLTAEEQAQIDAEFEDAIIRGATSIASIYMMDVISAIQDDKNDPTQE